MIWFNIIKVSQIESNMGGKLLPLFLIEFPKTETSSDIFNVRSIF